MIVDIGTVTVQFLFWEYLFRFFGIVSLQCDSALIYLTLHYILSTQKPQVL
jgi:hypothetical protein